MPAAPSSPPDPLMHEWGDMVASVRGRMREPTIRLEAILGSGAFGTVYKGEAGGGRCRREPGPGGVDSESSTVIQRTESRNIILN